MLRVTMRQIDSIAMTVTLRPIHFRQRGFVHTIQKRAILCDQSHRSARWATLYLTFHLDRATTISAR